MRAVAILSLLTLLPAGPPRLASAQATGAAAPGQDGWRTLAGEPRERLSAEAVVERLAVEHRLRAISVALAQNGRIAFSSVRGEVAPGRAAGATTVFRGASLSKPVFAYLVLRLVDEGILDLDSPIDTFLRRPLGDHEHYRLLAADPRHERLTVRTVLSQQSGLPNWHREGPVHFVADPATRFGYSGEAYRLLQLVVEERTGRTVPDLARAMVFEPLGMTRSSFLWESRFDQDFAVDLDAGLGPLVRRTRVEANVAGSLVTNAVDYARFLQAVLDGRGLSRATHDAMFEPQVRISSSSIFGPPGAGPGAALAKGLSWTLGWGRFESERGPAIFHLGLEEGCEAYAVAFLESRTALASLAVSPLESTFTAPLAAALIGDTYSPFDWLEYSASTGSRPLTPTALVLAAVAASCILAAAAFAIWWRRVSKPEGRT